MINVLDPNGLTEGKRYAEILDLPTNQPLTIDPLEIKKAESLPTRGDEVIILASEA